MTALPVPSGHDWDREIADRLFVEAQPYSSSLHAAMGLIDTLRRRKIRTVISKRASEWLVEFHRSDRTGWDSGPIGARGVTLPEAVSRAAVKLAAVIEVIPARRTRTSRVQERDPATSGS